MKNEDDECFKWCVARALNPVENHPERITQKLRKQAEELNWKGIEFPMQADKIEKFEKINPNISVNVYYIHGDIQPLRISGAKRDHNINLLLIEPQSNPDQMSEQSLVRNTDQNLVRSTEEEGKKHYCLIKNMSRLLSSQTTKHNGALVFCLRCLSHFPNNEKLEVHEEYCSRKKAVKIIMPEIKVKDTDFVMPQIKCFKNLNRFMKLPFVVYADFKAFLENMDSCEPDYRRSFTEKYQKHKHCGFCYKIVCLEDISKFLPESLLKLVLYRARNEEEHVSQLFVDQLEKDIYDIYQIFKKPKKMIYTRKDKDNS